jgi:hypothetical protein
MPWIGRRGVNQLERRVKSGGDDLMFEYAPPCHARPRCVLTGKNTHITSSVKLNFYPPAASRWGNGPAVASETEAS